MLQLFEIIAPVQEFLLDTSVGTPNLLENKNQTPFEYSKEGREKGLHICSPAPTFPCSTLRDITNKPLHVEKHIWKQKGHVAASPGEH